MPEAPTGDTGGCVGRLGNETFLAPQLITQAAHVKVDRATGVVRVLKIAAAHDSGAILNRTRRRRAGNGGVVMGVGLALSEGTMLDDEGRQRNPHLLDYKLVTCADAPEIEVDWIQIRLGGAARAARRASASLRRCRPPPRSRTRSRRCSARRCGSCR